MKRIGIISDTHSYIDDRILEHLTNCDEIWHAGDIGDLTVTDALAKIAPLKAVYGNIDSAEIRKEFPLDAHFQCEGAQVYITHIAGRPGKYPARVKAEIKSKQPQIFVCGHSHICLIGQNKTDMVLHINPGAAGRHGFHQQRTLLRMTINSGQVSDMELVELGKRSAL